jgi:MFS family permease
VGFLCLVVSFPFVLDRIQAARGLAPVPGGPSEPGLGVIFWLAAALSALAALSVARLRPHGDLALRAARGDVGRLLRHPPYLRLLGFTFGAYFFLQGPINLFPVLIRARGGGVDTLGTMWIPMLLLEIPLIFLSGRVLQRIGARGLLAVGVLADGTRWLGAALVPSLWPIYALQLLHGVVVMGLILGVPLYVEQAVPERLRSSGQAFVGMIGVSLASVLSAVSGGLLLEHLGTEAPFLVGGAGALALAAALPLLLPRPERPAEPCVGGPGGPGVGG